VTGADRSMNGVGDVRAMTAEHSYDSESQFSVQGGVDDFFVFTFTSKRCLVNSIYREQKALPLDCNVPLCRGISYSYSLGCVLSLVMPTLLFLH
jgi:hypothetical protein